VTLNIPEDYNGASVDWCSSTEFLEESCSSNKHSTTSTEYDMTCGNTAELDARQSLSVAHLLIPLAIC